MLDVTFSRRLALLAGLVLPALELLRRRRDWPGPIETWHHWLDDFLLSAVLLLAVWMTRARPAAPRPGRVRRWSWLTAAWGFVCGAGFGSLLAQVNHLVDPTLGDDPSGLAHGWVALVKAGLLGVGLAGLVASMRGGD